MNKKLKVTIKVLDNVACKICIEENPKKKT